MKGILRLDAWGDLRLDVIESYKDIVSITYLDTDEAIRGLGEEAVRKAILGKESVVVEFDPEKIVGSD